MEPYNYVRVKESILNIENKLTRSIIERVVQRSNGKRSI